MKGQELKILFKNDKAYLTPDKPLSLDQIDLPDTAKSFKESAFWTIKVLNYVEVERKLFCEILSYQVGEVYFSSEQRSLANKLKEIEKITFRNINTSGLLRTLASTSFTSITFKRETPVFRQDIKVEPIKRSITETFSFPLKNIHFRTGRVSFEKKLKDYAKTIEISIENNNIREEFDAVKNYFAKVLNVKKIQVKVTLEITDTEVTSLIVKSPEIDKIDSLFIDNVKIEVVKATKTKVISDDGDKNIFTMEEYFDTFGEENFQTSTFYNDEKQLLEDLMKITNAKHYKQLRFLSSKHCHQIMKLRFIHKPFSFIFLIEGDRNYHLIWETLDTEEATYVWHIDKKLEVLKPALKKIDGIITTIRTKGKISYINSTEDSFQRLYHDYSEAVDSFINWKAELESLLK